MNEFKFTIESEVSPRRLDQYLREQLQPYSRNQIQGWIEKGYILCNGKKTEPAHPLRIGDFIDGFIPEEEISLVPEKIDLDIVYEDKSILAVNKPAGLATHPAPGNLQGTLANGISYHLQKSKKNSKRKEDLSSRIGLVHRLDKETSGLIIVAKDTISLEKLSQQFRNRSVEKVYRAIVCGKVQPKKGEIEGPIEQDHRLRKMVLSSAGRFSKTDFKTLRLFKNHTYLEVYPRTGRTHQIRVHLAHIGHPVLGDKVYGSETKIVARQMLHAYQLTFHHPKTGKEMTLTATLPKDFQTTLNRTSL